MKIFSILVLTVATLSAPFCARAESLDDANRAFAAGRFDESVISYESVLRQHGYSAPVLFDLGNAYYNQGNYASAILCYKRALWLSPGDPEITANLQLAQKKAGVAVAEPRMRENFSSILNSSAWAWVGCAAWTLLCVSLFARVVLPQLKSLFSLSGVACAVVLGAAIAGAFISADAMKQAVVTDKDAKAVISPFPSAQVVFSPAPGDTVTVQETYGDFVHVADSAGHNGWMNNAQLTRVVAP